jgi:hypothetical protein
MGVEGLGFILFAMISGTIISSVVYHFGCIYYKIRKNLLLIIEIYIIKPHEGLFSDILFPCSQGFPVQNKHSNDISK